MNNYQNWKIILKYSGASQKTIPLKFKKKITDNFPAGASLIDTRVDCCDVRYHEDFCIDNQRMLGGYTYDYFFYINVMTLLPQEVYNLAKYFEAVAQLNGMQFEIVEDI